MSWISYRGLPRSLQDIYDLTEEQASPILYVRVYIYLRKVLPPYSPSIFHFMTVREYMFAWESMHVWASFIKDGINAVMPTLRKKQYIFSGCGNWC